MPNLEISKMKYFFWLITSSGVIIVSYALFGLLVSFFEIQHQIKSGENYIYFSGLDVFFYFVYYL